MLRFICFLLGRPYEPCKSCETLKEQLAFERSEKKQLTETLLAIIHPKVIEQPIVELSPIQQTSGTFARRRAMLEAKDREEAKILRNSTNLGKSDDRLNQVQNLEKELGIEEKEA